MILTSRLLTVLIAFTFTFNDCGKAYAQDSAPTETSSDEGDDKEQENFMDQVGDVAKDAAKEAAIDAAKSIAVGVAASVARQAAEAASSFGAGAAIGAAKKAAVAAKQAASYAQAVKGAAELKGYAKKSTQTLIVAIVFGLVGITAIVGCKKEDAPGNIPAPSFYIWTVGSIAFMISEIVHFIKFKTISKKIGKMELDIKNKQQLQALEQQRQLLSEALKTARGKKTWTQILQAAYIAAGVAALAELAIEVLTERQEIKFDMKCGKDKDGEEGADGEQSTEQNTEVADTDAEPKNFNLGDAAKDGFNNAIGMDTGAAGGAGTGETNIAGDMASQYATQGVNKLFEEGEKAIKGDENKDGEKKDEPQVSDPERDVAGDGEGADPSNEEATPGEPPLQDDEEYCKPGDTDPECLEDPQARFYKKNKLLISESEFRDYKKDFLVDINSRVIMGHYASQNSDQLIVDIMNSKTDLDSYFVFDEWHQLRHGGVISPSIVRYEKMNKHNIINSFFKKESKDKMGLKEVLGMSLKFIKDNAFFPTAHAKGGGGKKAGKAIGKIMVKILAGFAEKTISGVGEKAIEHFQNKEEKAFEKKYVDKEKELTKAQEELDAEIEKDAEEIDLLKEKKTALEDRKREIAEEKAEATAEAAEEAAEAEEDDDEEEEEEEEEILKIFYLEEEENEFDTDSYTAGFNDESEITEEQQRLDAEIKQKQEALSEKERKQKEKEAEIAKIAQEQEQAAAKREGGLEGMAREKVGDLASDGVGEAASFISGKISEGGDKMLDINQTPDTGAVANANPAVPEGGPQEDVKTDTNKNKVELKDKINGLWQKLMGIYEKLFGSAPTRSALSAATAIMINQWILKEIKKQVGLLEKNIEEIDKMIAELKAQEGQKVDQNLMASKKDLERDNYNPDMTNSRGAGSGSYASGIMSSKFGGMDGVCLSGQGSNMQLSGCGCAQSNSCTRFPQHKVDSQYFPSAVSYGQSSVYDMASSMTNGNYRAATLSGMDFAKNAASMYRKQKSLQAKINKMLKSKGMAPIDFNKRAAAVMKKTFDAADASGVAEAYNSVHGSGRSRGTSAAQELDRVEQKQEFVTKANIPTINPKKRKGKGIKIEDIEEDEVQQVASKEPASIEELDLPKEEIQDRPNTSLFDIIHVRYIKTAYPTLLSEEAKSQ